jgi:o-succinylbenzoate synthase
MMFDQTQTPSTVVSIELFPVTLPLKKPLVMSTYRLERGPVLFVRIETADGTVGWGEAAADPVMSGETLEGMSIAVRTFAIPLIKGKSAFDRKALMHLLYGGVYGNKGAFAAVDMALIDVVARLRGVPAVEILGGRMRTSATALALIGGGKDLGNDVDDAVLLLNKGYKAFKLKVAVKSVTEDIATFRALRETLGPDILIGADANMGWNPSQAIYFANSLVDQNIAFLEQPCLPGHPSQMRHISQRTTVPLSIDESLHSSADLLSHFREGAILGASLKTIKLGGITPLVETAHFCHSLNLSVNLAMMMESSLATAAMVHAACAIPKLDWGLSLGCSWLAEDPVSRLDVIDSLVQCPDKPGWGVTVDEYALKCMQ